MLSESLSYVDEAPMLTARGWRKRGRVVRRDVMGHRVEIREGLVGVAGIVIAVVHVKQGSVLVARAGEMQKDVLEGARPWAEGVNKDRGKHDEGGSDDADEDPGIAFEGASESRDGADDVVGRAVANDDHFAVEDGAGRVEVRGDSAGNFEQEPSDGERVIGGLGLLLYEIDHIVEDTVFAGPHAPVVRARELLVDLEGYAIKNFARGTARRDWEFRGKVAAAE